MYVLCNEVPYAKKTPRIYELNEKKCICPVCGDHVGQKVAQIFNVACDYIAVDAYGNFFTNEGGHLVSNDPDELMTHKRRIFYWKRFILHLKRCNDVHSL